MPVGILGSGLMGGKLGTLFARAGHDVVFSYWSSDTRRRAPSAARLISDVGFDAVDSGQLRIARYAEPFTLLIAQLAYEGEAGPGLAYRFVRFSARGA